MNIDPLKSENLSLSLRSVGQNANGAQQPAPSTQEAGDSLSTETAGKVRAALAAMPEIRPEVVERGRQLLADSNYPTRDIIEEIAGKITPFSEE